MKKVLIGVFSLTLLIFLTSCQEKVTPEERLAEYVDHWNKNDFVVMYNDFLAHGTKEEFGTEKFVERQKKLQKDLGIENVKVTYSKPSKDTKWDKEVPAVFPLQVKMDTIAGPVEFEKTMTLIQETHEETENWFVEWNPSFIFPELEEGDAVRISTLSSKRGEIHDRNGRAIAANGSGFEIGIVPEKFTDDSKKVELAELLGTTLEYIDGQLNQSWVKPNHFVPIGIIAKNNSVVLEQIPDIPGVMRQQSPMREYPYEEALSHLSGYIGVITEKQLAEREDEGYTSVDLIGRQGMELLLEDRLRGKDGVRIYIDKLEEGVKDITVSETPAVNGETISLTINAELQKTIYQAMIGEPGTSAAVDPDTGETLALVSSPGFDPNELMLGISGTRYKELQESPLNPLFNRFTSAYAPGSTIKPMTAAIGLEAGTLEATEGLTITGETWQKNSSWSNYRVTRVHSEAPNPIDLNKALVYSDNIYFAQEALEMGPKAFVEGLKRFGFGEEIPFAYNMKSSQISNDGSIDSEGQLADTSFGQGQMLTNIIHLASMYGVLLTDGVMYKPTLFMDEETAQVWKEGLVSAENAALLRTSLRNVVVDGFAQSANLPAIPLAGKTGTAELKVALEEKGQENGFFVAYNSENPVFILAMMIEGVEDNNGSGYVADLVSKVFLKID
ncbi:penicillin-binding transpeptidase domain-containing protein [Paenisporosarcina sp. TG20]|uniref:penicillin-binding transpeptidase domain-containing protein n=1 Tax=Paenisporosarcina sp. TG20 TaxID=1211706 RepID=UPI0002E518E9|nr:penicillin-binding transpeptidase domain-containing protein [Paenisporosarcina sp. TG20]